MQALWAVPPPVADSEHRCMHFFSHDCCATVGTDIVARQSKADAQTSFDIIASLEVAICGPEYRCRSISGNNQNHLRWEKFGHLCCDRASPRPPLKIRPPLLAVALRACCASAFCVSIIPRNISRAARLGPSACAVNL